MAEKPLYRDPDPVEDTNVAVMEDPLVVDKPDDQHDRQATGDAGATVDSAKTWAVDRKTRNRVIHAGNGNMSGPTPARSRETQPPTPPKRDRPGDDAGSEEPSAKKALRDFLGSNFEQYVGILTDELGVGCVADLADVEKADLEKVGLKPVQKNRLWRAIQQPGPSDATLEQQAKNCIDRYIVDYRAVFGEDTAASGDPNQLFTEWRPEPLFQHPQRWQPGQAIVVLPEMLELFDDLINKNTRNLYLMGVRRGGKSVIALYAVARLRDADGYLPLYVANVDEWSAAPSLAVYLATRIGLAVALKNALDCPSGMSLSRLSRHESDGAELTWAQAIGYAMRSESDDVVMKLFSALCSKWKVVVVVDRHAHCWDNEKKDIKPRLQPFGTLLLFSSEQSKFQLVIVNSGETNYYYEATVQKKVPVFRPSRLDNDPAKRLFRRWAPGWAGDDAKLTTAVDCTGGVVGEIYEYAFIVNHADQPEVLARYLSGFVDEKMVKEMRPEVIYETSALERANQNLNKYRELYAGSDCQEDRFVHQLRDICYHNRYPQAGVRLEQLSLMMRVANHLEPTTAFVKLAMCRYIQGQSAFSDIIATARIFLASEHALVGADSEGHHFELYLPFKMLGKQHTPLMMFRADGTPGDTCSFSVDRCELYVANHIPHKLVEGVLYVPVQRQHKQKSFDMFIKLKGGPTLILQLTINQTPWNPLGHNPDGVYEFATNLYHGYHSDHDVAVVRDSDVPRTVSRVTPTRSVTMTEANMFYCLVTLYSKDYLGHALTGPHSGKEWLRLMPFESIEQFLDADVKVRFRSVGQ